MLLLLRTFKQSFYCRFGSNRWSQEPRKWKVKQALCGMSSQPNMIVSLRFCLYEQNYLISLPNKFKRNIFKISSCHVSSIVASRRLKNIWLTFVFGSRKKVMPSSVMETSTVCLFLAVYKNW